MTSATAELPTTATSPRIAILGAGNLLLGDDGVGVHAVYALQADPPEGVLVCEIGTRSLAALDILDDSDAVVVVDAMRAGGRPGTIYRYEVQPDEPCGAHGGASLHDLNIVGALRFLAEDRRPRVVVVGVEPLRLDCTLELSDAVAAALPEVVSCARRVAEELKSVVEEYQWRRIAARRAIDVPAVAERVIR